MDDTAALKTTPLHSLHISLGARMVPFAGYDMPVQYPAGVLKEHLQTRTSAGLFDVSHMGQVILKAKSGNNEDAARALEPALNCLAALLSPSTGIIDSHAYMLALQGDAERDGAAFAFHTPLARARVTSHGFDIETGGGAPMTLTCELLVNAAGLGATAVARSIEGMPVDRIPPAYLAKGNYFSCSARAPFSRLIYPVPEPGGLGVHLTLDLAGQARFGPDVEWVDTENYEVDPARAARFYPAIRRYWPALPDGALMPAYSGIPPKIVPPAVAKQDFMIEGPRDHGVTGLINLFGIESPGLTSSLGLADHVAALASE